MAGLMKLKVLRGDTSHLEGLSKEGNEEVMDLIERFVENAEEEKRGLYYERIVKAIKRDKDAQKAKKTL
jgi:hypothetical protein